ncbi:hypothetical protein Ae168Ps1_2504c [Pseudonocardia sp. Ae168_Ps1]|nr:hypothetical protein Ae150APs1_2497c [Pseudonocardia sp. Ae150A_Ps1]OLL80098.1 hypothetical protein Ae168Ps1_2504c [Pseudonocardia sp. Ae168_Ps1]OLL85771.1 hypothetical protein Ae263Ps1_2826 [Pseudonocardia sp. Ae263_Ps1]OLL94198.1 hypothetical protein Ae356Ps1_4095c [Pseudonocardia sp. Ae356_Ps1]
MHLPGHEGPVAPPEPGRGPFSQRRNGADTGKTWNEN